MESAIVTYKRSWREIFPQPSNGNTKKEKRSKKERTQRPVETAAAVEIGKVAFGDFLLMISTAAWKSRRTIRSDFSTVTTGPTAINN
jgi:hypothetical protein